MRRIGFLIPGIILLNFSLLLADVVTPGEVQRRFTIINLEEYSDYEFFFQNPTYYYDHGYQQGESVEVVFAAGKEYDCGKGGDKSLIYAREKGGTELVGKSDNSVGGQEILNDYDVRYILDEIEIGEVENGKIKFKVVKSSYVYQDGETKKIRKGMIGAGGPWYLIFAGVAALALILFFIFRRKGEFEK